MNHADDFSPTEEAETCRRKALAYLGCPEAPFLLSLARAFDDLAYGGLPVSAPRSLVVDDRLTHVPAPQ